MRPRADVRKRTGGAEKASHNELHNHASQSTSQSTVISRTKQRRYLTQKLSSLRSLGSSMCDETVVEPTIEFFLASLCDLRVPPEERTRLGLRYPKTPEVQRLLRKLHKCRIAEKEITGTDTNAIVSALKEILNEFPGGIFSVSNEDFICVSLHCSLEIALVYVNSLLEGLPIFLRQFTYLVCKSLRNLARQSAGSLTDSYTDLLLLFTPVLFPNSVGDVTKFLRATRITLILIDLSDTVFQPFVVAPSSLTDSAYHSDEDFFKDLFKSLDRLHDSFCGTDSDQDDGYADSLDSEQPDNETEKSASTDKNPKSQYYQITYVD